MFYNTPKGTRPHFANMHRVLHLCAIIVTVNTVIISRHPSRMTLLQPNSETLENNNYPFGTQPDLVRNFQRDPQPAPEATDMNELPPPQPDLELETLNFADSASIPVDGFGRPLSFPGTSSHRPLSKCCPHGKQLDERLERCVLNEAGGSHLLTLVASESTGLRCGYGEILRLGAVEAAKNARQLTDERLGLKLRGENGTMDVVLSRGDFCADSTVGSLGPFALLLCPCAHTTCVRKCCPRGQLLVVDEEAIVQVEARCEAPSGDDLVWQPRIEDAVATDGEVREGKGDEGKRKGFALLEGTWPRTCHSRFARAPPSWALSKPGRDFKVLRNGSAFVMSEPPVLTHNYCVDFERRLSGILVESIVYCSEPLTVPTLDASLSGVGMVGSLGLLATIVVHCVLPEMRATPFGRSLMCYAAAFLLAAIVGLSWTLAPNVSGARCIFNVMWSQYFQLAAAFWLNVMCYDMGIAFRSYQGPMDRMGSVADRRFLRYSQYAWGCPFLVTFIMLCLQFTQSPGDPWRPIEYYFMCNYASKWHFLFLYVPMLILLLANLTQFIWITCRIRFLQKDSDILTEDEESKETSLYISRKRLMLFLKLLWAMGVFETVLEMSVWATTSELAYWHITNVVDLSRSLSIFALSCCKRRVLVRLRETLPCAVCPRRNRVAPERVRPVTSPHSTESSGLNSSDTSSSRNTTVAGVRKTVVAGDRVAGNTIASDSSSDNAGFQSRIAAGEKSRNVRINPFGEPSGENINPFVERANRHSGNIASVSKKSDASEDRLAGKQKAGSSRATINGMISPENDLDDKPVGDIEMRVISTTSL